MQMSQQHHHLHTGQVPTASQQPHQHQSTASHLHGQQLQINAQQQHTMSHHQQHQVMMSQQQQQQQQSHINITPQHYGLSASHNANVAQQSMENLPMAQQPHYMNQQINHSQPQQLQRQQHQQQHQFLQQQQQYRQGQLQQVQVAEVADKGAVQIKPQAAHEPVDTNPMLCVRRGCTNLAIISDEWEDEYCSNECAVSHCREVFNSFHKGRDPESNYTH